MYVCMYVCVGMYVCTYVCMYVCMYVRVCMYICTIVCNVCIHAWMDGSMLVMLSAGFKTAMLCLLRASTHPYAEIICLPLPNTPLSCLKDRRGVAGRRGASTPTLRGALPAPLTPGTSMGEPRALIADPQDPHQGVGISATHPMSGFQGCGRTSSSTLIYPECTLSAAPPL